MSDERGTSGEWYVFMTPNNSYTLTIEERPNDPFDTFCVTVINNYGYEDWTSDSDLRGAIGVAVMRIIRRENNLHPDRSGPASAPDATPPPASTVASSLAMALLEDSLRKGKSVSIPSLGIVLTAADLRTPPPASASGDGGEQHDP